MSEIERIKQCAIQRLRLLTSISDCPEIMRLKDERQHLFFECYSKKLRTHGKVWVNNDCIDVWLSIGSDICTNMDVEYSEQLGEFDFDVIHEEMTIESTDWADYSLRPTITNLGWEICEIGCSSSGGYELEICITRPVDGPSSSLVILALLTIFDLNIS